MRRGDLKRYAVGAGIAALYGWGAAMVGNGDYEHALIQDAIRKDPPPEARTLAHPLSTPSDCDATVIPGHEPPRCYYFRENRKSQVQDKNRKGKRP